MRRPARGCLALALCAALPLLGCASERSLRYRDGVRGRLERRLERASLVRVKPWERDVLSRRDMAWRPDALQAARRAHVYFAKEASLIGGSAGGGGCGCN